MTCSAPDSSPDVRRSANVTGNARITGSLGAAIFVLLVVEGLTILRIEQYMWLHVLVGMLLVAFTVGKVASTGYRFFRYYFGAREYVRKGPPPTLLRFLGPIVTITSIAVLATGVATLQFDVGGLAFAHKASFVVWFAAMTVHVLGHILETPALAFADWRRTRRRLAPGASLRFGFLAVIVSFGVSLAILSRHWADHWHAH